MRVGAYQFAVTGNADNNFLIIKDAIRQADEQNIELLVFPECALTGYPPRDFRDIAEVDFDRLNILYDEIQKLSDTCNMCILIGTITRCKKSFYNSALIFIPNKKIQIYNKRALWGWDKDNFIVGNDSGIVAFQDWKIGIRICYEIRFPEFFRELYKEHTDINIVLFNDVSESDNIVRYDMIKSHIMTRAVENVTYTLTANTSLPFQTAPTILFDRSGRVLQEVKRNEAGLLVYDMIKQELDFGELGRKEISDWISSASDL